MVMKRSLLSRFLEVLAIVASIVFFLLIFYFVVINSFKTNREAAQMNLALPEQWNLVENYSYVFTYNNGVFLKSLWNSSKLTFFSILLLVILSSMTAFIMQRRKGRIADAGNRIILAGLIVPPAIIPTYWVLNNLHLARTFTGLTLVEVASMFPYAVMIYKGFLATVPNEIDEAALIDGCGTGRLFINIIFPLLKPITAAIIILRSVVVYNDFSNPMYFLPGAKNSTVQLCIYLFQSMFLSQWGYLFAAIVVVSLLPFILYLFLNKRIIEGMTIGAVKG